MAKKKYIDYKKMQAELFKRTEGYAANVRIIYQQAFERIINLVKGSLSLLPTMGIVRKLRPFLGICTAVFTKLSGAV